MLLRIKENNNTETNQTHADIILQILDVPFDVESEQEKPILKNMSFLISDGCYFTRAMIVNDGKKRIQVCHPKPNDIISCNMMLHKGTTFCIMDFIIIRDDVKAPIGDPKDIHEGPRYLGENSVNAAIPKPAGAILKNVTGSRQNMINAVSKSKGYKNLDESQDSQGMFNDIAMLTLYSGDFTIRGRVIEKAPLKQYQNQKGGGCVFSFNVIDHSPAPKNIIRCTMFNEIATQYYDILQNNNVYVFSGGDLRPKNKSFNMTKHDIEIIFNRNTSVKSVEDSKKIAEMPDNFELLINIEKYEKYHALDIMVIVKSVSAAEEINLKKGGTKTKRIATVYDESGM